MEVLSTGSFAQMYFTAIEAAPHGTSTKKAGASHENKNGKEQRTESSVERQYFCANRKARQQEALASRK